MTAPNILVIMVDQLAGTLFPDGPAPWLHTPHLRALADRSARFTQTYAASPLCAPSRASFMTGMLPSRSGVYDNAAELPASTPTFVHRLRAAGYRTVLSGKMHFVGPDQLHGFEERLTTDVYPADFAWTPDYRRPDERVAWWYHNLGSVTGAGVAETTNQMEYDDEVAFHAEQELYKFARRSDDPGRSPWLLTVSFTHPHDPYVARRRFWDLYADCEHLAPEVPPLAWSEHDPHSRRILQACDHDAYTVTDEHVARARRAYFANLSYLDEKIGSLLDVLTRTGMHDDTYVVFCSDHGDMLGERGLWYKMSFLEHSARVPLMVAGPDAVPGARPAPASMLDVGTTLCELVDLGPGPEADPDGTLGQIDACSLAGGVLDRPGWDGRGAPVPMEYAAEASRSPMVALRDGDLKITRCTGDPDRLVDLRTDPHELRDLVDDPGAAGDLARLRVACEKAWDLDAFDTAVRGSQARRRLVGPALRTGGYRAWDHQPFQDASQRFMRNHLDLDRLEAAQRFPRGE